MNINWPEVFIGALVGALLGLGFGLVASRVRKLRRGYISFSNGEFIEINKTLGKVTIDEPRDGTRTGAAVTLAGTVTDFSGNPLDASDVVLLAYSSNLDGWQPVFHGSVWPDTRGKWKVEIVLKPETKEGPYEILGAALPPDDSRMIRDKTKVRLEPFPRCQANLARLHLYYSPRSCPVPPPPLARYTDWLRPEVQAFLERSDLTLPAIDGALVTWACPISRGEWGWRDDHEISLEYEPTLVDDDLPVELLAISDAFRQQNPGRKDSIKYCVTEFLCDPQDAGGRLRIRAQATRYLATFPVSDELFRSLRPAQEDGLRARYFPRLVQRSVPLVPNMLIAHVLVITGDRRLLLGRRRADRALDYFREHWSATYEEHYNAPWSGHLQEQDVHPESMAVDETVFSGLRRSLEEEMCLSPSDVANSSIRVLAVGFEYDNMNTSIYALVSLPGYLTARKMQARLRASEEHDRITSCAFDMKTLSPVLMASAPPQGLPNDTGATDVQWKWHPTARMRILLALRAELGELEVRRWLE